MNDEEIDAEARAFALYIVSERHKAAKVGSKLVAITDTMTPEQLRVLQAAMALGYRYGAKRAFSKFFTKEEK